MTTITDAMVEAGCKVSGGIAKYVVRQIIEAALASLSHTMGVKVKELEWEELGAGFSRAKAPLFGSLRIERFGDAFNVLYSIPGFCDTFTPGDFETLEAAKAAAQADYEQRIRSALTHTQQPVGPFGWLVKDHADGWFFTGSKESLDDYERQGHATKPVFASPQAVPGWEKEAERVYAKVNAILSDFDAEVSDHLANESERADLWGDIDIPVALLREIKSALSILPTIPEQSPTFGDAQSLTYPELNNRMKP